jgi:hypothetical protein
MTHGENPGWPAAGKTPHAGASPRGAGGAGFTGGTGFEAGRLPKTQPSLHSPTLSPSTESQLLQSPSEYPGGQNCQSRRKRERSERVVMMHTMSTRALEITHRWLSVRAKLYRGGPPLGLGEGAADAAHFPRYVRAFRCVITTADGIRCADGIVPGSCKVRRVCRGDAAARVENEREGERVSEEERERGRRGRPLTTSRCTEPLSALP